MVTLDPTSSGRRPCDIVMKGGITSGVVYPLAALKLSDAYTFRNVGGTSAGAIAAAAVAAAERGRANGQGGFDELRVLPAWLGSHLQGLFRPAPDARPVFALLLAVLAARTPGRKVLAALGAGARHFGWAAALGALPGIALAVVALAGAGGWVLGWALFCAVLLAVAGAILAVAFAVARRTSHALSANGFGLSPGHDETASTEEPALTDWLDPLLSRLAGFDGTAPDGSRDRPLTFGDLWGRDPGGEREIDLQMMSTNLTEGRPCRMPGDLEGLLFDPAELRRLFPERVVTWMLEHRASGPEVGGLVPLPAAADLPVVLGVRMSLSFPLLISAIPLHAVGRPSEGETVRCWFSDGGIVSNFPVHLFDSPLPRWPTFAINLDEFGPDHPPSAQEADNVWLTARNEGDPRGARVPPRGVGGFLWSIIRTMQNWRDNEQSRVPGYRDRIVHIGHSADEGGLNLTMPPEVVQRLSERGGDAGAALLRRFAVPAEDGSGLGWDNHRWVRYRSYMALLQRQLQMLGQGYRHKGAGDVSVGDLNARALGDPPPAYAWGSEAQRSFALEATDALLAMSDRWDGQPASFTPDVPEPQPDLRVVPRT